MKQNGNNHTPAVTSTKSLHGNNGNNLPANIGEQLRDLIQKRQSGRASEFTAEKGMTILEALIDGDTIEEAAKKAGTTRKTYYVWREVVPGFGDMIKQARKLQAESFADDGVKTLVNVDVENSDPKQAMALLRRAEQITRFKFDLAKCYNSDLYNPVHKQVNVNLNAELTDADVSRWFNK